MWLIAAAATVVLLVECGPVRAQIFYSWDNPSGGSYNTSGNWFPFGVPDNNTEGAGFDLSSTYTVSFPTNVTTSEAYVSSGTVTFDLDTSGTPRTYTIAALTVNGSGTPWLNVDDGTVSATISTTLGDTAGAGGIMAVRPGGTVTTPTADIGDAGSGYLVLQNFHQAVREDGIFNTGNATLGKTATGNGQAEVYGVWNTGPLTVGDSGDGFLSILGATTIDTTAHTYGGRVYSTTASIGAQSGSFGDVYVHGMAFEDTSDIAYWNVADNLYVGGSDAGAGGTGFLTIDDLGVVDVAGLMHVFPGGTVTVNAGGTLNSDALIAIDGGSVEIQSGGAFNLEPAGIVNPANGGNFSIDDHYLLDNDRLFKATSGSTMDFPGGLDIGFNADGAVWVAGTDSAMTTGDAVWGDNHAEASVVLINEATMETGDLRLAFSDLSGTGASVQIGSGPT